VKSTATKTPLQLDSPPSLSNSKFPWKFHFKFDFPFQQLSISSPPLPPQPGRFFFPFLLPTHIEIYDYFKLKTLSLPRRRYFLPRRKNQQTEIDFIKTAVASPEKKNAREMKIPATREREKGSGKNCIRLN
jgi:hypothetical protein